MNFWNPLMVSAVISVTGRRRDDRASERVWVSQANQRTEFGHVQLSSADPEVVIGHEIQKCLLLLGKLIMNRSP